MSIVLEGSCQIHWWEYMHADTCTVFLQQQDVEGVQPYDSGELRRTIYDVQRLVHNGEPGFTLEDLRTVQPAQVRYCVLMNWLESYGSLLQLLRCHSGHGALAVQGSTTIHLTMSCPPLPQMSTSGGLQS